MKWIEGILLGIMLYFVTLITIQVLAYFKSKIYKVELTLELTIFCMAFAIWYSLFTK